MKLVRFKKEYCADINNRISYELVSDEIECQYMYKHDRSIDCYELKLLGFIPVYQLEEADGTETPAIDVFVKLSNQ